MTKVTITLPEQTLFRNVGGEPHYFKWAELPESVLGDILVGGALVIMNNTWNGTGKDGKEVERMAAVGKRWDSWKRGQYLITERAASQSTLMREAYVNEMLAKHDGLTAAEVEKRIKETVKQVMGKDTNATFDNFLLSIAQQMATDERPKDEVHKLLVAKYEKAAAEVEAVRAKAASIEVDLTAIDI